MSRRPSERAPAGSCLSGCLHLAALLLVLLFCLLFLAP